MWNNNNYYYNCAWFNCPSNKGNDKSSKDNIIRNEFNKLIYLFDATFITNLVDMKMDQEKLIFAMKSNLK